MALLAQLANEYLREHNRYSGDGKPGAPAAPLPVGDPQSGRYNPSKQDLRRIFGAVDDTLVAALAAQAAAEAARDLAQGYTSDAVSQGNVPLYSTRNAVQSLEIPEGMSSLRVSGHATVGDGGAALYKRVVSEPSHAGKVQSDDGAWWEIAERVLSPVMLGAVADGSTDDYPAVQATLDVAAATGARVHFPEGVFKMTSGSPKVSSNTVITGEGKGKSILVQPNYYSYERPGSYVKASVVDWNGLWMDVGTSNVDISGLELRGPFWQPDDAGYTSNPVENWPASNGIHVRGSDYQWRKSLTITGESFNVRVHDCHLEGWAEDAIQCDMVTHLWVERNTIARCGRGGFRGYSCVHSWVQHNSIDTLSPGDYLNNGNRMYGIEFTRTYQSGVRASADFWVVGNRVRNCLQWKGMGTHGGQRGRFLHNDIIDCHHGIGIDKGGFEEGTGIAPPRDIQIVGNRILRSAAGDETEGNGEGGAGHAIFVTAHDGTSTHLGHHLVVSDNICEGWGCENLNGGAWIGNWAAVTVGPNVWRTSFGMAIRLRDTVIALNLGPQTIRGVTRSSGGNQRGVSVEASTITGIVCPQMIENVSATELTAIFLANDSAVTVQDGHSLRNTGGGTINECNIPANDRSGPMTLGALAVGRITVAGDDSVTINGHRNIVSCVRNSEGNFTVTLAKGGSGATTIFPIASSISTGGALICHATAAGADSITVITRDTSGTLTDGGFVLHVFGF